MWITILFLLFLILPLLTFPYYITFFYLLFLYIIPIPAFVAWNFPLWNYLRRRVNFSLVLNDGTEERATVINLERRETDDGKDEELKRPLIHAIHPHGRMNLGHGLGFIFNIANRHVWTLYGSYIETVPLMSIFLRSRPLGTTVTDKNIRRLIKARQEMSLCPGGIREMYLPVDTIIRREGFLNIAWETKCDVIPYFSKGETSAYGCYFPFPDWWWHWSITHLKYSFFAIVIGDVIHRFLPLPLLPRNGVTVQLIRGKLLSPNNYNSVTEFTSAYYVELCRISGDQAKLIGKK